MIILAVTSPPVRVAFATIFRRATKLPGILIPSKFESRFRSLRFENHRLRETLGWTPPLDYQQCLMRTYGQAPSTAIESDNQSNNHRLVQAPGEQALPDDAIGELGELTPYPIGQKTP